MHRLLIVIIVFLALGFGLFQIPSVKREVVYKLGISGDPTTSCCTESDVLNSNGDFDESASTAFFNGSPIEYPKTSLAYQAPSNQYVLGTTNASGEEKWIEVSLSEQKVRAWEGNRKIMEFLVSTGLHYPTPKGTYHIWYKTRHQRMQGGSRAHGSYYNLPNVPHNMFFYQGYALHGAYWHNNFGNRMSHGCVNEPLANAAEIFEWAGPVVPGGQNYVKASAENPGTRVYVH
jgi:lipoprotein-anchoring transpeptidase ErfK/SrfK